MEEKRPGGRQTGGGADDAPAVVLPAPDTQAVSGGPQGFAPSLPPVLPQPLLDPASGDGLPTRVENALAEDGRFAALITGLRISAEDGVVRLSGAVPDEHQRRSLLSAARSVRGVSDVEDGLTAG